MYSLQCETYNNALFWASISKEAFGPPDIQNYSQKLVWVCIPEYSANRHFPSDEPLRQGRNRSRVPTKLLRQFRPIIRHGDTRTQNLESHSNECLEHRRNLSRELKPHSHELKQAVMASAGSTPSSLQPTINGAKVMDRDVVDSLANSLVWYKGRLVKEISMSSIG